MNTSDSTDSTDEVGEQQSQPLDPRLTEAYRIDNNYTGLILVCNLITHKHQLVVSTIGEVELKKWLATLSNSSDQ